MARVSANSYGSLISGIPMIKPTQADLANTLDG